MLKINPLLKTIMIGYGNPGRQDDGLGPAFIDAFQNIHHANLALQSNYQLTVEDALELNKYEQVIFIDACIDKHEPFSLEEITETNNTGFGSHSLSPQGLIQLTNTLYQHYPKAYILAIKGYEFDLFEEKLSDLANTNLHQAIEYLASQLNA